MLQTVSFSDAPSYQLPTFSKLELELENIFGVVFERDSAAFSAHKASFDDALTRHFSENVILPNSSTYCIKFHDKADYIGSPKWPCRKKRREMRGRGI